MSAYAFALVNVKDQQKMQEYAQMAGPTFAPFGGELLARGQVAGVLSGVNELNLVAVMKFPDLQSIDQWYQSPEYQKAIATRELACDMTILKVQSPN